MVRTMVRANWNAPPGAPGPGPGPNPAFTYTVPTSIDHTGATDVTAALQAFFNGVPDGTSGQMVFILFQPSAIYRCESTLTLVDRKYLDINMQGATIERTVAGTVRTNYNLSITSSLTGLSTNINIYGGTIHGANPATSYSTNAYNSALEAQHNVNINGNVGNVTIGAQNGAQGDFTVTATCVNLLNPYGDHIYIGAGLPATAFPFNIRVTGCIMHYAGRQAISPVSGTTLRIDHNTVGWGARHCFDAEPDGATWVVNGLEIDHNTVLPCKLGYAAGDGAGTVNNVNIHDNSLTGMAPGLIISNRHPGTRLNWTISNETTDTAAQGTPAPGGLFQLTNVDGFTATNINVTLAAGRGDYGMSLIGCTGVTITGCSFPNSAGVFLERAFVDTCTPPTDNPPGGTTVALTGTMLDMISGIDIGGVPATSFVATSPTAATCVTPAGASVAAKTTLKIPADSGGVPQPAKFTVDQLRLSTVVVTNSTATITYAPTTDYTLTYLAGAAEWALTRVTSGGITALESVIFNYQHYPVVQVSPMDTYGAVPNGFNFQYESVD